jgi:uncharacterized membrane protein
VETLFLILGPIAFFVALGAHKRITALEERLKDVERALQVLAREVALLRRSASGQAPKSVGPEASALDASQPVSADQQPPTQPTTQEPQPVPGAPTVPPIPAPAATGWSPALPSSRGGLEEELGTRWVVWVGGLALALGGILLVRYSIERDFFGPGVRVLLGMLLAAALISSGEWFRRGEIQLGLDAAPSAHIPSVLTAAGTTTAFATIYAAHALYDFIGPGVAFVLLGLAGVATMLASALHGPALAGLGLVGAFLTPLLVSSPTPNPWPVVLYLAAVAGAAFGLARLRHWLWLAVAVVAGVGTWGLLLLTSSEGRELTWTWAAMVHSGL